MIVSDKLTIDRLCRELGNLKNGLGGFKGTTTTKALFFWS